MPKKTVDSLIDMDYNALVKLSRTENVDMLRSVVKQMTQVANRRINNLMKDEVGKYSPALKPLHDAGMEKFTTKGLNNRSTNDLMHDYSQLKKFLKAKSSTISGWKEIRSNIAERTGAKKLFQNEFKSKRSATIWHNREARFWKLYNKLQDNYGGVLTELDSNRIQEVLQKVQTMRNQAKSDEDISMAMTIYIDNLYRDRSFNDEAFLDALKTEEYMEEVRIAYAEFSE